MFRHTPEAAEPEACTEHKSIVKEAVKMPFNRKPQKFNAAIKTVEIGTGDKKVTLGGENVFPFYAFDGEIMNGPKVGVEISDLGLEK